MEKSQKCSQRKKSKQLTEKEIEERRRKCRERVRKCRAKMTEEKIAEKRAKDREYKQKMKDAGIIISINELSKRQQLIKRRQWKKDSYNYRKRNLKRQEEVVENSTLSKKGSPRVYCGRKIAKQDEKESKMGRKLESMKAMLDKKERRIQALRKQLYRLKNPSKSEPSP